MSPITDSNVGRMLIGTRDQHVFPELSRLGGIVALGDGKGGNDAQINSNTSFSLGLNYRGYDGS